jgi:hypothetical protein
VDLDRIEAARKPARGLEIALSFIALGKENADLKTLVLQQRARPANGPSITTWPTRKISAGRTAFDTGSARSCRRARRWSWGRPRRRTSGCARRSTPCARRRGRPAGGAPRRSPRARFASYFSPPPPDGRGLVPEARLVARAQGILEALLETVAMAPPERRRLEAVELLEHLLRAYRLSTADWFAALGAFGPQARQELADLGLLCPAPGSGGSR